MRNKYTISDGVVTIYVNYKGETLKCFISEEDFYSANSFSGRWYATKHFTENTHYVVGTLHLEPGRKGKRVRLFLHRVIMNAPKGLEVDHLDRDGLNNTKSNLRLLTTSENLQNKGVYKNNKTSGIRGVSWDKSNKKWRAYVQFNRKQKHIGCFDDLLEAEKAVKEARAKYMPFSQEALHGGVNKCQI